MTAHTQISFCRVGSNDTGSPIQAAVAGKAVSETIRANGASQVTDAACPDNTGCVRIVTEPGVYVSCGPAPDALNDVRRLLIPAGLSEVFPVRAGDRVAISLAA